MSARPRIILTPVLALLLLLLFLTLSLGDAGLSQMSQPPGYPVLDPPANSHAVPLSTTVSITYDAPISPTSVSSRTFAVHGMQSGLLDGIHSVDGGAISFNPLRPFQPGEPVQTSATTGTLGLDGQGPLAPTVWGFRAAVPGGSGRLLDSGQALGGLDSFDVSLGDLDGDGDLDAYVANAGTAGGQPDQVWLNDGGGRFDEGAQSPFALLTYGVALGDLDGDGDLDAFLANVFDQPNRILLNDGNGDFADSGQLLGPGDDSSDASLGDLDGDGDLDAFVANWGGPDNVWLNDGTGTFSSTGQLLGTWEYSAQASLGDVDGDGDLDAMVATWWGWPNRLWINDGTGWFVESVQPLGAEESWGVELGDLDGDGDLDAFFANYVGQPNTVWLNDGAGIFADSGQHLGGGDSWGVSLGDLDGDQDLDAYVANHGGQPDRVWLNDGQGRFRDSGYGLNPGNGYRAALGDLDADGDLDVFVANDYGEPNQVWLGLSRVVSAQPEPNGHTAAPSSILSVTLNGVVDRTTVTTRTFALHAAHHGWLPGAVNSETMTFDPAVDLSPGEEAEAVLSGGVLTADGQPVAPYVWRFRAAVSAGSGTFVDSGQVLTPAISSEAVLGDLDGDADLDAFVINLFGPDQVWLNDGHGILSDSGQQLGLTESEGLALGDVDGDGDLDAFVANGWGNVPNLVWLNDGAGNFSDSGQTLGAGDSKSVVLADLDGDADLDAFVGNCCGQANTIWLNDGGGQFTWLQSIGWLWSESVALGDLDSDGDLDAFVANGIYGLEPAMVWLNNGSAAFSDSGQALGSNIALATALGDLDGDGDLDAVVGTIQDVANELWLNDGHGTFALGAQSLGTTQVAGLALADVDGDGDLDALLGNTAAPNTVWLNDGAGTFADSGQTLDPYNTDHLAVGDLDGDGDLDVLSVNGYPDAQPNHVWFNESNDLVMEELTTAPGVAYPGEAVLLTAQVRNAGTALLANVPVRFDAAGVTLASIEIAELLPASTGVITFSTSFTSTGTVELAATVNPEGTVEETNPDNNTLTATLDVVWEKEPHWTKTDLVISDLSIDPPRPEEGDTVTVTALLGNPSRGSVVSTSVALMLDNVRVDELLALDVAPGSSQRVTLTWPSATPGRHPLRVEADPEAGVPERRDDNNREDGWIWVGGVKIPLPAPAVVGAVIPPLDVGEPASITVDIYNAGFAGAENLPVDLTLNGRPLSSHIIPSLGPGETTQLTAPWSAVESGQHIFGVALDSQLTMELDSVQRLWATEFNVPGPQVQYSVKPPSAAQLSGQWEFAGPRPIQFPNEVYNGRMDGIAISQQDSRVMVLGTWSGGVWRTEDGGQQWSALADHLPSSQVQHVGLDPQDDRIIYGFSPAGVFKSTDGGAHWSLFTAPDASTGRVILTGTYDKINKVLLRYEQPDELTIYVAGDDGLWVWQGAPDATRATPNEWFQAWRQTRDPRDPNKREVSDFLITAEGTPSFYTAVYADSIYRVALSALLTAVDTRTAPTWTALDGGLPLGKLGWIEMGNSAAQPQKIYSAVSRGPECAPDDGGHVVIYSQQSTALSWTRVSTPTDTVNKQNICGIQYVAFLQAHPTKPGWLYIGGVKGWRSKDGGKTFDHRIPYVHDDFKDVAFDPGDPASETLYFTSDGGVFRCTQNGDSCIGLNDDLETTMFYDLALGRTEPPALMGGTQDNGTLNRAAGLTWDSMSYAGDGKYVAFDPAGDSTRFAQYQYADSVARETGTQEWSNVAAGIPTKKQYSADPFMAIHPQSGNTMLMTAGLKNTEGQVYRTTNALAAAAKDVSWSAIGPDPALTAGSANRVAFDLAHGGYYAGTTKGQIWAVTGAQAASTTWSRIYSQPSHQVTAAIVPDPADANVLYVSFGGSGAARVVRLEFSGTTWPGTANDWTAAEIAGLLPDKARVGGGPLDTMHGLLKDPRTNLGAEVLYVGSDRGVYQGRLETGQTTWQWEPDTCGLPLTYVSDLELNASGTLMAAGTYGRGAYTRSTAQTSPPPDAYDTGGRNDEFTTAVVLGTVKETITQPGLYPGLVVRDLNMDRTGDRDFFKVTLPAAVAGECLPPGAPQLADPRTVQCALSVRVFAPDTPDPFELKLYHSEGSEVAGVIDRSYLTYRLERPRDTFANGEFVLSVRSLTGCRSKYELQFWYHRWYAEFNAPELLFEPPLFNWLLPTIGDFPWLFPADPAQIDLGFVGQAAVPLAEQRVVFEWEQGGDLTAEVNLAGAGGGVLNVTLYDATGGPVAAVAATHSVQRGGAANAIQLHAPGLPAGWYALGFQGDTFPTYFDVAFDPPPGQKSVYLPLVLRGP